MPDRSAFSISGETGDARVAASVFTGLDRKLDALAVIDLEFCPGLQIEAERQLHERNRRSGVAGYPDIDQHHQLSGFGKDRVLLYRAFERRVAACAAATRGPARLCRSGVPDGEGVGAAWGRSLAFGLRLGR